MKQSIDGLLVLDKPSGLTSRDGVNQAMKWFPPRTKIGHTGTLDPLATGVLVLCLGRATRLAEFVQEMDKTYQTTLILGATSDTDDADGAVAPNPSAQPLDVATIATAVNGFIGTIEQAPPRYSAVKLGGRRAHALARQGETFEIAPRPVEIDRIDILEYTWPELRLEIACGKGTYIRSLARDLGERLGVGAYVAHLRRTRVGPFAAVDAVALTTSLEEARRRLRPPADAVGLLPRVVLDAAAIAVIRHGQRVAAAPGFDSQRARCAIFSTEGELIGVGLLLADGTLQPVKII